MQASYDLTPLLSRGLNGAGQTIVIVDAFGSSTISSDLNVFDTAFGLPHMCGEPGVVCGSSVPSFTIISQGSVPPTSPPPSNGTGQEAHNLWSGEVTLDVEWAHSMAPMANIVLLTTPTAEILGVQGFPDFMKAEQFAVEHHLGAVISQSFGSAEEAFGSTQSLLNLRYAFQEAQAAGVTVLGSSGDSGTANVMKQPTKKPTTIPFPTVEWPASDPLVTGVGGTYLCTNPFTGVGTDSTDYPAACQNHTGQREVGWIAGGGGFSHVFATPDFQQSLPAGSTFAGSMRGVPDVAYQASGRTGVLVYLSFSGATPGWYVFGGTSSGSPQWAGLIAIASQINGGPVGYINPALYKIGADPVRYANDFFDVMVGSNQLDPVVPGYFASTGWDPVTGLGTPNAANLLPDLVLAVHGH
jgi:subtilase family serine protease